MLDYSAIEKAEHRTIREIHKKEGTQDIYIVLFTDNLEEDWRYKDGNWYYIA